MQKDSQLHISNDIVLRPRFQRELAQDKLAVLEAFESYGVSQKKLIVKRVDDHVFIRYPKQEQEFWTPQLDLEINENDEKGSKLYGLFGPSPNVWLAFMFLHLIVATVFLGFGLWGYSNWSLGTDYFIQVFVAGSMLALWVLLYIMGRLGRATGKPQMQQLHACMEEVLSSL